MWLIRISNGVQRENSREKIEGVLHGHISPLLIENNFLKTAMVLAVYRYLYSPVGQWV